MKTILSFVTTLVLITFLQSCNSTKAVSSLDVLTTKDWELTTINGQPVDASKYNSGVPVANFSKDNKISGNGGCNRYSGSYNLNEEGGINISQVIATKMFCPGDGEGEYMKALETANAAMVDKDKLVLLNGVDEVLVFKPKQ
ncbi:META domain-containing protein [Flavobacterium sp. Sd200]|uniref:META domain-containing protein n=1 Tax=Flavobacterium sp. Sd200 TaxID=2692211 RepID=UPI001367F845|nr:META domain-containing protein [Flavobacterium sp. Sd200]MXN92464.1 META domain-containing protein [Flavobacterium sp. Sd200]